MYREYRFGDFPDIEITNASIIKPLIELAKRDDSIARTILSSIMNGFKNDLKIDDRHFEQLNKSLTNIIDQCHDNPFIVGFILDTAYCFPKEINLNPTRVCEVSSSCGLISLGALVIETSMKHCNSKLNDKQVAKKLKTTNECSDDIWIKLAEMYKNIGELDVVEGIFQDKINNLSCDSLQEALKAGQSNDWHTAQIKFKSVLEYNKSNIFSESDKDFLFEEYYKCLENLSDWKEINTMLKSQVGENYEKVWNKNWYKKHLLPRILHSELHKILMGVSDGKFIEIFNSWLSDTQKEDFILTYVAAQASMIFLCCDDFNKTQLWCKLRMRNFIKEWVNIPPQYYKLRADRLLSLQNVSEIYYFTKCIFNQSSTQLHDNFEAISKQIQTWGLKLPVDSDSLLLWDVKILNRSFFFKHFKKIINELPFEEKSNSKYILNKCEVKSMLTLIENAIKKNNFHVAKKYMNESKFENIENWKSDFILCRSKIIGMYDKFTTDFDKKLDYYIKSLLELDGIDKEQCSSNCLMKMHLHTADMFKHITNVVNSLSNEVSSDESSRLKSKIMNLMKNNYTSGIDTDILQQIDYTIINNLKRSIHISLSSNMCTKTIIDTYLILSQYCLEKINNNQENIENNQNNILFIESVLKAMNYGSKKASELFPIILQIENLSDTTLKETFITESKKVPEYMFLQWINQIISCLDSPLFTVIDSLLIRISEVYPKAIQLPLRMHMEKDVYNNKLCEEFMKTKLIPLTSDLYLDLFLKALSNVCCPFIQLIDYINNVIECMQTNCLITIVSSFENIFKNCFITEENKKFKGKEFNSIKIYKDQLKVILDQFQFTKTNKEDYIRTLEAMKKQIYSEYCNKQLSINLNNFCPWLAEYSNHTIDTLEIPGQYSGLKKHDPNNHITIASFKQNIQIIHSMRYPIKITMIGNNGEEYSFLVKFGEDLRQDQRVQQLLKVMNNTLSENVHCCERQLSILTYTVFPVSKKLGMIEWINNTVTLKDFICESFPGGKVSGINKMKTTFLEHDRWLSDKFVQLNKSKIYAQATIEYNSIVTIAKFKQLVQSIPADILSQSLLNMCHCAEMYVYLRSKFITSYSVLSICHWLLGIGDRHLNNTIISKRTGNCIGIDFNFAFHTATSIQIIPELIPFRMSPHIVSLMTPLNLTGFIRESMVHTLKTIIDNREILLAVMQVFINDPSADWVKIAKKEVLKIDSDLGSKETQWFPKKKILSSKDKMNGINPIEILSRELKNANISIEYKNALLSILKSDSQNNKFKRSELAKSNITPYQQVDCLLDLATDAHILGKSYGGLELWI